MMETTTMTKQKNRVYICNIDEQVNGGKGRDLQRALWYIERYITKNIDPTFPSIEFREWVDSDSEKPFLHNGKRYYWDN